MNVVPDASVVVKWFIPERGHAKARDIRDGYLDLVAPAFLPYEAVHALRYFGYNDGDRLVTAADALSSYGIDLRPFAGSGALARIAEDFDVTVYDASYVALAETVDGRAYTSDEALLSAVDGTVYADRLEHVERYD